MKGIFMLGDEGHPDSEGEPVKVFSVDECMDSFLEYFASNPGAIRNQCMVQKADEDLFEKVMIPAVTNKDDWDRIDTSRPYLGDAIKIREELEALGYKRPEGCEGSGTDMVVREFDNIVWDDYGKELNVKIVTEFGHIIGMMVKVYWD